MSPKVERTPDREPKVAQWMADERERVVAAFNEEFWPTVEAFIESVPWESDAQRALVLGGVVPREGRGMTEAESMRDVACRRTAAALTRAERIGAIADHLGIRYEEMERKAVRIEAWLEAPPATPGAAGSVTALYRHYDEAGVLLYVGIADKPAMRAEQHKGRSKWWRFVAATTTEWLQSRAAAEAAERDAIAAEAPVFNKPTTQEVERRRSTTCLTQSPPAPSPPTSWRSGHEPREPGPSRRPARCDHGYAPSRPPRRLRLRPRPVRVGHLPRGVGPRSGPVRRGPPVRHAPAHPRPRQLASRSAATTAARRTRA